MKDHLINYLENMLNDYRSGKINIELTTEPQFEEVVTVDSKTGEVFTYSGAPLKEFYTEKLTISPAERSTMGCDA